ncbi:hypothetical protein LEP1GSC059_1322 [Leptospira noguchii serovar Panama str. CZ214]|uniref:Uncharacterized protein n=1 Tax=Leptospira noguchii serovar Panama str. CZ214 TaxID=1001595 RepID=T0FSW8_9LEPT|nr:hypothetical protein LEP1GSC059_1322 [Leptospira noguchii serovar Panama str. CZ214]
MELFNNSTKLFQKYLRIRETFLKKRLSIFEMAYNQFSA